MMKNWLPASSQLKHCRAGSTPLIIQMRCRKPVGFVGPGCCCSTEQGTTFLGILLKSKSDGPAGRGSSGEHSPGQQWQRAHTRQIQQHMTLRWRHHRSCKLLNLTDGLKSSEPWSHIRLTPLGLQLTIGVGTRVGHGQQARMVMLQLKAFVLKFLPIDALPAAAPQPRSISTAPQNLVRYPAGSAA